MSWREQFANKMGTCRAAAIRVGPMLCNWVRIRSLSILSSIAALYFFIVFHLRLGFPPLEDIDSTDLIYLILAVFFCLLPLAKKINIAKFIEYEAKVQEIESEVKEFKEETRQILAIYNNMINAVSNTISQTVTVNIPSHDEAERAREQLDATIEVPAEWKDIESEINEYLASEDYETNYALAKLRMDIERELRRILGKRIEMGAPEKMKGKFLSVRSLFKELYDRDDKYRNMFPSFDYVLKVCNAAIHGQAIPQGSAHEALYMGLRILNELKSTE